MKDFTFSIPQNIVFGKGSIRKLPELAQRLGGKHAFLISGPHLKAMGTVQACIDFLSEAGIPAHAFTETEGNPSVETVDKATRAFLDSKADFIVALGGGSPMDVAKAVGILARYGGSITLYEGADKVPGDIVPLIAVPTTAGTGSEVTAFSVITDHSRDYKLTVFSYKLLPAYAILDPELLYTAPPSVAAACGIDALIHALEAYLSTDASPFSEAMSEKALELIGGNIRLFVANRKNEEAAAAMLAGSLFAGIAFSWARLGNVHAMSHPVSACFHVPHGIANAILLPTILEYNSLADNGKYLKIYNAISKTPAKAETFTPSMLVEKVRKLNASLHIPGSLKEVGVDPKRFEAMAEDAMKSGNILVNPRSSTKEDIVRLYQNAYESCL
jgi:alcohol dehydrogenase